MKDLKDILSELNPEQKEAVLYNSGPLVIFAGAGSGKTKVLTYKAAYLLSQGVSPRNILAVTFTNKAAEEMRSRIIDLVGADADDMWIGTFHATCARILRIDGEAIGLPSNFVILDEDDQLTLIKELVSQLSLSDEYFQPKLVLSTISRAKENLVGVLDFIQSANGFLEKKVATIYKLYEDKKKLSKALDFDDLIFYCVRLLRERQDIREKWQDKFRYILVDEFQDVNYAQYELVKLLGDKYRNISIVGDDDQSIYGWRGADFRLLLQFEKDFPNAKVIKLERNYRSPQTVLDAAWSVIKNNRMRKAKRLWTDREGGEKIRFYEAESPQDEARFVGLTIRELVAKENRRYGDFVILYRVNAQSRAFEETLMSLNIPYKIIGGLRFFERKEIKDIVAYLRVIANPDDNFSLRRIIDTPPRGIGPVTMGKTEALALEEEVSLYQAFKILIERQTLQSATLKNVEQFLKMIEELREKALSLPPSRLIREVLEKTGYWKYIDNGTIEGETRKENLQEFIAFARELEDKTPQADLNALLERVSLLTDIDTYEQSPDAVTLMTLHAAKGLEFPVVFIVGLEEGLLPHSRSLMSDMEIEEERRLLYVGMTRAKDRLFLSRSWNRSAYGGGRPSRFINEIPEELLERVVITPAPSSSPSQLPQVERIVEKATQKRKLHLKVGDKVKHEKFGEGMVIQVEQLEDDVMVTVFFNAGGGSKRLLLSFAPLKKI
ncbi:UvrD-helicase domain-containing protein [bacterium]|nr:UvrD-helicase domain-containing protein [bacterium]